MTDALLLRKVDYRDADIVATFMSQDQGKVSTLARGARRSRRRFGGGIEPFHTVRITVDDQGRELLTLKDATVVKPRTQITTDLERVEAAGTALRWARHLCPPRIPEPDAWGTLIDLLDVLDGTAPCDAQAELARAGMRLLSDVGWGLDLEACVRCGKVCPDGRAAFIDVGQGGIVCAACGGAARQLSARVREAARAATLKNDVRTMVPEDVRDVLSLVEDTMAAHADLKG